MISENIVYLSRRNLLALLGKLDANAASPGSSACAIVKHQPAVNSPFRQTMEDILVVAVEDEAFYGGQQREAGRMHPREEVNLPKPSTGVYDPLADRQPMTDGMSVDDHDWDKPR